MSSCLDMSRFRQESLHINAALFIKSKHGIQYPKTNLEKNKIINAIQERVVLSKMTLFNRQS